MSNGQLNRLYIGKLRNKYEIVHLLKLQIVSKDGGLLSKDNFEGGATWAYEVGSQAMVCPIIVEDLNQPRQMLVEVITVFCYISSPRDNCYWPLYTVADVCCSFPHCFPLWQMLCEERGLFLEIADVIRGLGLTILKGVMETRKDNIWAHFAVEVIVMNSLGLISFTISPKIYVDFHESLMITPKHDFIRLVLSNVEVFIDKSKYSLFLAFLFLYGGGFGWKGSRTRGLAFAIILLLSNLRKLKTLAVNVSKVSC